MCGSLICAVPDTKALCLRFGNGGFKDCGDGLRREEVRGLRIDEKRSTSFPKRSTSFRKKDVIRVVLTFY